MNKRMILYIIGVVLVAEAALMLLPAGVALIYAEERALRAFLASAGVLAVIGGLLTRIRHKKKTIYSKEGFVAVALCWIALSLGGSLPFMLSGDIPSFIDAFFETVSGFTTTGASILSDVEALSHASLFWRSFTHWVGGMGVLIFVMAALPLASGGGNIHLMRAESPGYDVSKLVPSSRGTAFRLYAIYFFMTVLMVICLLICGNPLFDSLTLSFGAAGTGGFAIKNDSIASYSAATQDIITIFMTAFGINFSCYYLLRSGKIGEFFRNEEVRLYLLILVVSTGFIVLQIAPDCVSLEQALRTAAFQTSSVMTTTGYSTVDFNQWPELSRMIMLLIMCIGACVGSTGGGIKVARVAILVKAGLRQVKYTLSPNRVESVRFNGKAVSSETVTGILTYFALYMLVFVISILLLALDDAGDTVSNLSGVIATLNNIGPGLEKVGAVGNYGSYHFFSKLVFIFDMLAGRLELLPIFALFFRRTWESR